MTGLVTTRITAIPGVFLRMAVICSWIFMSVVAPQYALADERNLEELNLALVEARIARKLDPDVVLPDDKFKANSVMEPLLIGELDVYELTSNSASMDVSIIFVLDGVSEAAIEEFKVRARKSPNENVVLAFTKDKIKGDAEQISKEYMESWKQISELNSLKITYFTCQKQ